MEEFLLADSYKYIYLGIIAILVVTFSATYRFKPVVGRERHHTSYWSFFLGAFFILFFGFRPTHGMEMADTAGYASVYELMKHGIGLYDIDWASGTELVWKIITNEMAKLHISIHTYFTVVAAIYIFFNLYGIKQLLPQRIYPAFLFYIAFFLFYSGGINGIRNADAYSIVFFAISLCCKPSIRNYIWMAILFYIAYQIHSSVMVTIGAFLLSKFLIKNVRIAIIIWIITIIFSLIYGSELANTIALFVEDERVEKYLDYAENSNMMKGFSHVGYRWDFLIYSALPIVFGYYVVVTRKIKDSIYILLLNTYILANAVWVVFIYAAFSNRFAMLSWCIYPYIICYPLLKYKLWPERNQTVWINIMLWMQYLFTCFMTL